MLSRRNGNSGLTVVVYHTNVRLVLRDFYRHQTLLDLSSSMRAYSHVLRRCVFENITYQTKTTDEFPYEIIERMQ